MSLKRDGKEYAIGNMALKNSTIRNHDITEDKYVSIDTMLLSHAAFSVLADQTFSLGNVILALPLHKLGEASVIKNAFEGHRFGGEVGYFGEYEGKMKQVQIDKALTIGQPHGTLFNLILDDSGQIANKELATKGVAVFDIGYKTNDGVVFKNLEPLGRLFIHSKNGMSVAYEEIRSKINSTFNIEVKTFEVPQVIKTGTIKGISVQLIINDALYNLASNIILELKAKWGDAWEIEQIVFTGGGSVLLKPYLQQAFDAIYMSPESNAEGLLKYAKRLWGREAI
jgi:plasmid segregation protein ParM